MVIIKTISYNIPPIFSFILLVFLFGPGKLLESSQSDAQSGVPAPWLHYAAVPCVNSPLLSFPGCPYRKS